MYEMGRGKFANVVLSSVLLTQFFRVIKSRIMRLAGHVAHMGERRGVYRVLVGKSEGKRPLGRLMHRWEDNIPMDLEEVGCEVSVAYPGILFGGGG